jgi:hypothetical protein
MAVFLQLATAYRLLQMMYGCYKAYRFVRACWNAARSNVRRIRPSIRTMMLAEVIRTPLANWLMRRLAAVFWSVVREIFLSVAALIGFYVLLLRRL